MEDFECDSFYDMDLDLDWDSEDILSSAIQECDIGDLDEGIDLSCKNLTNEVENTNAHHEMANDDVLSRFSHLKNDVADYEDHLIYPIVNPSTNMPNLAPWTPTDTIDYKISIKQEEDDSNIKSEEIEVNQPLSVVINNINNNNNYDSSSDSGIDNAESEIITTQPGRNPSSTIIVLPINMIKKKTQCSVLKKKSSSRNFHPKKENNQNDGNQILSKDKLQYYQQRDNKVSKRHNLTKDQKQMRRKIRNREAAQKSRIQKKMYVSNLEAEIKEYMIKTDELLNQIEKLKEQNTNLLRQSNMNMYLPLD